ncbi:MAG TPA: DNA gyrase inhibitor YacG [Lacipirellulaceae bacterium]
MRCPVCQREFEKSTSSALPFCSERCRTIDLGRWLGESYSLPTVPEPDTDEAPDPEQVEGDGHSGKSS